MSHTLAIITVVYQNYSILENFFESLEKQTNKNFHVFIVDLSKDTQLINTKIHHSIYKSENLGYAHGINIGIKNAIKEGFSKFCVMNCDTYVAPDFIDRIIIALIKNSESIIGGKIYYAPEYEYHKTRYQKSDLGKVIWYAGGTVDWKNALTPHRGVDEVDNKQFNKKEETEFVNGCLMCFDKLVVDKVGFWDETYFLYFEDSDYCERAKRKNIKLFYDPSIIIWHKNAQSTEGSGSKIHQKYQEKNRLIFGLKYAPFRTKIHLLKNYLLKSFVNK